MLNTIFINFIICVFIFLPSIIIVVTLKGNKPFKVKEDILFIEKQVLKCLIMSFYILMFLYELLKAEEDEDNTDIIFLIKIICFNIYIILLFMNNFFLCLEDYFTYTNPLHYFNSLFHHVKNKVLYEFISILIPIIISSILIIFNDSEIIKDSNIIINNSSIFTFFSFNSSFFMGIDDESISNSTDINNITSIYKSINEESPFIIFNFGILILICILNIIIIIIYIVLKCKIKKIIFKTREKLLVIFNRKIITSILYILFASFNITLFIFYKKKNEQEDLILILRKTNSFLFLSVYCIDGVLEFKTYSTSKFAKYKLKYTIVESIGNCFTSNQEEDVPSNTYLDSMIQDLSQSNGKTTDDGDEETSLMLPLNNSDIELVLIYRNKIYIEDYFFYYYDYIMNVTLVSLLKIYKNKNFSPTAEYNKKLNKEMNITESDIFDGGDKTSNNATSNGNDNSKKTDNIIEEDYSTSKTITQEDKFEFIKNSNRDDFSYSSTIFTNTINDISCDNLKVRIKSYFTSKCISNLFDKNFTTKMFCDSLKSHLDFDNNNNNKSNSFKNNKNNISCENFFSLPYHSILSCNAKEEYFIHLRNMVIKTYDKQLTFDIFETNDDDIDNNNNSNKKLAKMLDEYFDYIKGVGVSGTFLPIILGIFKVKINSFKTMLIYISCNSLIENTPSNSYSYWQLVRFSSSNTQKVASSKYRHGVLIKDDLIFDRKDALPSIKGVNDVNYNKIEIKNYLNFEETINHDIFFLNRIGINNSNLLMMYFEYENTQKHEQGGAIKIKKTGDDKAEIVNTSIPMPIMREDEEESNAFISDFSKKQDSEVATFPTITITIPNSSKSDKKYQTLINKNSLFNDNIKSESENKKNIVEKENIENENIEKLEKENMYNDIGANLDISKSIRDKESLLKKSSNSNEGYAYGSINNMDFLDDAMLSFDEFEGNTKKRQISQISSMLNYSETIKLNSYDGYFDDFNCMCLFSFENIFDFNSKSCCNCCCCCDSNPCNKLKDNIISQFSSYVYRKHTSLKKKNKSLNKK